MFVAESNQFKIGDIAVSNKYGTRMTVTRVENDRVECAWFNKAQKPFRELFLIDEVTIEKEWKGGNMNTNTVIENNFTYHSPNENQVDRYKVLREKAKELAYAIDERCPSSREKSLAMTNLEQAIFWANASIARQHENSSASGS